MSAYQITTHIENRTFKIEAHHYKYCVESGTVKFFNESKEEIAVVNSVLTISKENALVPV